MPRRRSHQPQLSRRRSDSYRDQPYQGTHCVVPTTLYFVVFFLLRHFIRILSFELWDWIGFSLFADKWMRPGSGRGVGGEYPVREIISILTNSTISNRFVPTNYIQFLYSILQLYAKIFTYFLFQMRANTVEMCKYITVLYSILVVWFLLPLLHHPRYEYVFVCRYLLFNRNIIVLLYH